MLGLVRWDLTYNGSAIFGLSLSDLQAARTIVESRVRSAGPTGFPSIDVTDQDIGRVVKAAAAEAHRSGHAEAVSPEHLCYGLLTVEESSLQPLLMAILGKDSLEPIRLRILRAFGQP